MVVNLANFGDRTLYNNQHKEQYVDSQESTQSMKDAIELSTLLYSSHKKEFPDYLSGKTEKELDKTLKGWAKDIEKLNRIDKKDYETIRRVVLWAKTPDRFWFSVIRSGANLRKHFDRIYEQMATDQKKQSPPSASQSCAKPLNEVNL